MRWILQEKIGTSAWFSTYKLISKPIQTKEKNTANLTEGHTVKTAVQPLLLVGSTSFHFPNLVTSVRQLKIIPSGCPLDLDVWCQRIGESVSWGSLFLWTQTKKGRIMAIPQKDRKKSSYHY